MSPFTWSDPAGALESTCFVPLGHSGDQIYSFTRISWGSWQTHRLSIRKSDLPRTKVRPWKAPKEIPRVDAFGGFCFAGNF